MHIKNLIYTTLLILFFSSNIYASNLFIGGDKDAKDAKDDKNTTQPIPLDPPSTITVPQSEYPSSSTPSPSQKISDFANIYYKNCLKQKNSTLAGYNLKMMCACSSAQITKSMTIEQVNVMTLDTPEGQIQRNRMLLYVYTPCIQYPARALLEYNCLNDSNVKAAIQNHEQVCTCLADNMAIYTKQNAPTTIAQSLVQQPEGLDPLSTLVNSSAFQRYSQSTLMSCLQKYGM